VNINNYFPSNIQVLRKALKLSQAEICDRTGFKRTTWSNYETGYAFPAIDDLLGIASFFGVTLYELIQIDISKDVRLIERLVGKGNTAKSTSKSTPISTANEGKTPNFNTGVPSISELELEEMIAKRLQEKDEVIEAQKGQISALNQLVAQLRIALDKK